MPYKDLKTRKEYLKVYFEKNESKLKKYSMGWREKHKEKKRLYDAVYRKTIKARFSDYRGSAKRRRIGFFIDIGQFENFWKKPCFYCGGEPETIGIDRVDSEKPYIIDNLVSCCVQCNQMKLYYSHEQFIDKCKIIAKHFA